MLNYPACAFPVTAVDPTLDRVQARHTFLSEDDKKNYDSCTPVISGMGCGELTHVNEPSQIILTHSNARPSVFNWSDNHWRKRLSWL